MARVTGIIPINFSPASDLFPGERDIRITMDSFSIKLSTLLEKLWALKGVEPKQVHQHEVLVFYANNPAATNNAGGSGAPSSASAIVPPVFTSDSNLDALRPTSLRKDTVIQNYTRLEIALVKISAEKQRQRDADEEEEELLRSLQMEQRARGNQNDQQGGGSSKLHQRQQQQRQHQQQQQQRDEDPQVEELRRKATLCSRSLPLHYVHRDKSDKQEEDNIQQEGDASTTETTTQQKSLSCLLCRESLRGKTNDTATGATAWCVAGEPRCRALTCDACFDYCFRFLLGGKRCPVCGLTAENRKNKVSSSAAGPSARPNILDDSSSSDNNDDDSQSGSDNDEENSESDDELEMIVAGPKKFRRIE